MEERDPEDYLVVSTSLAFFTPSAARARVELLQRHASAGLVEYRGFF